MATRTKKIEKILTDFETRVQQQNVPRFTSDTGLIEELEDGSINITFPDTHEPPDYFGIAGRVRPPTFTSKMLKRFAADIESSLDIRKNGAVGSKPFRGFDVKGVSIAGKPLDGTISDIRDGYYEVFQGRITSEFSQPRKCVFTAEEMRRYCGVWVHKKYGYLRKITPYSLQTYEDKKHFLKRYNNFRAWRRVEPIPESEIPRAPDPEPVKERYSTEFPLLRMFLS
jgi:hypothetical protein